MDIQIDLFNYCEECPCHHLLTEERKKRILTWNELFYENLSKIKEVKLIILGESMPANRYFYDKKNGNYDKNGFRFNLRKCLGINSDDELFLCLQSKGVIVVDCAFCALHKLGYSKEEKKLRKKCATYCLKHYNKNFILNYEKIPIFSFFPKECGVSEDVLSGIKIDNSATFTHLYPIAEYIKNMK